MPASGDYKYNYKDELLYSPDTLSRKIEEKTGEMFDKTDLSPEEKKQVELQVQKEFPKESGFDFSMHNVIAIRMLPDLPEAEIEGKIRAVARFAELMDKSPINLKIIPYEENQDPHIITLSLGHKEGGASGAAAYKPIQSFPRIDLGLEISFPHEFSHVVGQQHEHERSDAKYIIDNKDPSNPNVKPVLWNGIFTPHDSESSVHFHSHTKGMIIPKDNPTEILPERMGQDDFLSVGDQRYYLARFGLKPGVSPTFDPKDRMYYLKDPDSSYVKNFTKIKNPTRFDLPTEAGKKYELETTLSTIDQYLVNKSGEEIQNQKEKIKEILIKENIPQHDFYYLRSFIKENSEHLTPEKTNEFLKNIKEETKNEILRSYEQEILHKENGNSSIDQSQEIKAALDKENFSITQLKNGVDFWAKKGNQNLNNFITHLKSDEGITRPLTKAEADIVKAKLRPLTDESSIVITEQEANEESKFVPKNAEDSNEDNKETKKPQAVDINPLLTNENTNMNNLEKRKQAEDLYNNLYIKITGKPPCPGIQSWFDPDRPGLSEQELDTVIALLNKGPTAEPTAYKSRMELDFLLRKVSSWEEFHTDTLPEVSFRDFKGDFRNSPEWLAFQKRAMEIIPEASEELKKLTIESLLSSYIASGGVILDSEIIIAFDQIKAIAEEYPKHQGEIETLTSNSNAQSDQFAGKDNSSSNPFIKENRKDMSNEIDTKVSTNAPTSAVPEPSKEEGLIGAKESKFSSAELQNLWALQAKESNSELFKDPDSKKLILEIAKNIEEMGQSSYVHSPEFEAQRNSPKIKSIIEIMNKLLENEHDEVKTLATNFAIEKALKDENLITDLENLNDIKEVSKKVYHEYREGKLEGKPQQQTVELLTKGGLELLNLITFLPRLLGRVVLERIAGFDLPFLDGFKSNDYLRNILPNIESTTPSDAADITKPEDTSAASVDFELPVVQVTLEDTLGIKLPSNVQEDTTKSTDTTPGVVQQSAESNNGKTTDTPVLTQEEKLNLLKDLNMSNSKEVSGEPSTASTTSSEVLSALEKSHLKEAIAAASIDFELPVVQVALEDTLGIKLPSNVQEDTIKSTDTSPGVVQQSAESYNGKTTDTPVLTQEEKLNLLRDLVISTSKEVSGEPSTASTTSSEILRAFANNHLKESIAAAAVIAQTALVQSTSMSSTGSNTLPIRADTSVPTPATLEPETPKSDDDAQENQSAPGALNLNVTQGTEPAATDGSSTSPYGDLTSANQFGFFQPFDSGAQQEDSAGYSFDA